VDLSTQSFTDEHTIIRRPPPVQHEGKDCVNSQTEKIDNEGLIVDIIPKTLISFNDCLSYGNDKAVVEYKSLVREEDLPNVRRDCDWGDEVNITFMPEVIQIMHRICGFFLIYTYPFSIGFVLPLPKMEEEFLR
ncbi:hypothetical protein HAX54_044916, partial [Datura stramonium]|nr:hypothetical protein [Datura stramonium]